MIDAVSAESVEKLHVDPHNLVSNAAYSSWVAKLSDDVPANGLAGRSLRQVGGWTPRIDTLSEDVALKALSHPLIDPENDSLRGLAMLNIPSEASLADLRGLFRGISLAPSPLILPGTRNLVSHGRPGVALFASQQEAQRALRERSGSTIAGHVIPMRLIV